MRIYTWPKSRSLRVLWLAEELHLDYKTVKVDLLAARPTLTSPHPRGKVPFLIDGDIAVAETLAICFYLCEKNKETSLYPTEVNAKTTIDAWLSFSLTDLESPVWNLLKLMVFTPEDKRSATLVDYFKHEAENAIAQVSIGDNSPWLAGENFTLADIFMSHTLLWAKLCGIDLNNNLKTYIERAMSRPAFLRARQRNDR